MNPDISPTPRTDVFRRAQCEDDNCPAQISAIDFARKLERELAENTDEIARLRELLNRAIEVSEDAIRLADLDWENDAFGKVTALKLDVECVKEELAQLTTPPEEPKQEEERPLLRVMEYCRKWADEHLSDIDRDTFYARLGLLVDFATDFYSDQIEALKKNQK